MKIQSRPPVEAFRPGMNEITSYIMYAIAFESTPTEKVAAARGVLRTMMAQGHITDFALENRSVWQQMEFFIRPNAESTFEYNVIAY